jgi:hypothetical protein
MGCSLAVAAVTLVIFCSPLFLRLLLSNVKHRRFIVFQRAQLLMDADQEANIHLVANLLVPRRPRIPLCPLLAQRYSLYDLGGNGVSMILFQVLDDFFRNLFR